MRPLAYLALFVVLVATPSALGVTGGSAVDVRDAPWSALVLYELDEESTLCTGAILDSLHVLTAAHCVVENDIQYSASNIVVLAGLTNLASPSRTDRPQERSVASLRVHKGYRDKDESGGDDVAVLTLSAPLNLSGPTAAAIALPSPSFKWKIGDSVTLAGYGLKEAAGEIDGTLNGMNGTLVDQSECLPPSQDTSNGVLLCTYSGTSSPCSGDSGGALVLNAGKPVIVGVTRAAVDPCRGNSGSSYADVTAPEILEFIKGNDDPPIAPRPISTTRLERPTAVMQVGQTVTCKAGGWSGSPTLRYELREDTNGTVVRRGPSPTYKLGPGDAGRLLFCRVIAVNDGGTTFDESVTASSPVQSEPALLVQPTTASRGGMAVVRVRLLDWVRPFGKVDVCVTFSPRIGGKVCRTATPAGAAPTVVMALKVKASAPVVRARAAVSARAADGRTANRPGFVNVR